MPVAAAGERRQLPYEALDPEWEAREFHKFRSAAGGARQQAPYGAYLFGRLLQSDLHQSCRPALPPDVAKLNGATIQGVCILQVVDVANIGANYEHRTEFSAAGPTRTLKLGLTDGHQLVFGFEFSSLPQFSVNIARGTKIVVENVPVRHGLLLLAPDNCQLLETSSDRPGQRNGQVQQPTDSTAASAGAYSAALVTSQFNQQTTPAVPPVHSQPPVTRTPTTALTPTRASVRRVSTSTIPEPSRTSAVPSVFVDVPSSDEDMDSDTTDPMVEHLFYSPKTPRQPAMDVNPGETPVANTSAPSRKRPRSPSLNRAEDTMAPSKPQALRSMDSSMTSAGGPAVRASAPDQVPSVSLLNNDRNRIPTAVATLPPVDPTRPFQYFTAKLSTLSAAQLARATRFQIRACIKSVVGFQFNTGRYQLRVSVEDCTATKEADVAEAFVTRLMGVPCSEFLQTMKTKVQVAHGWAASMQFALMTLEGVMTFEKGAAASLLLIECRDYQPSDTRELLQRVKAGFSHTHR